MQSNIVDLRAKLAEKMAGEITLSHNPGETIKKWRKSFEVSQIDMANSIGVSPSVISDYESGRRKSPGTTIISKIVEAMLDGGEGPLVLFARELSFEVDVLQHGSCQF